MMKQEYLALRPPLFSYSSTHAALYVDLEADKVAIKNMIAWYNKWLSNIHAYEKANSNEGKIEALTLDWHAALRNSKARDKEDRAKITAQYKLDMSKLQPPKTEFDKRAAACCKCGCIERT